MYQQSRPAGTTLESGGQVPVGYDQGLGVRSSSTQRIFVQGSIEQTDNPLDACVQGEGFFQVTMPDGSTAYTRDGSFKRDSTGNLVTSDGYLLNPAITIPTNATGIVIGGDGQVSVTIPGQTTPQQVGQITLAQFANPAGLTAAGRNLYVENAASGTPTTGTPGTDGLGTLTQGYLEGSNVKVVDEMVAMITAQRAYEINARVIQGADQMMGILGELKR
jgi:flagellar basal-body rod protein FlgG